MALTDESGVNVSMPVAPMNYGGGFGGFGNGDWSWIIVLILFGMFGGWGNGGFGGGGNGGLYPWLLNDNTQGGFNQAATSAALAGIQTSLTTGFSNAEVANCGRTIDALNRSFDAQNAVTSGLYSITSALQNCCCENRAGIADLKYTIATEACNDRAATAASTQAIMDKLCALELDAKNEKIADLQRQLTTANFIASQGAQTAAIIANNEAQTTALEQYLAPTPRPAYIVQNPNCCTQNYGCGCVA